MRLNSVICSLCCVFSQTSVLFTTFCHFICPIQQVNVCFILEYLLSFPELSTRVKIIKILFNQTRVSLNNDHIRLAVFIQIRITFQIINLLQEGGAERLNYFSDYVTHLIAGFDALENDICEAKDLYEIPAVTQDWILYSVKCKKLLPYPFFK